MAAHDAHTRGRIARADDWTLVSEQLGPVARIYKANGHD